MECAISKDLGSIVRPIDIMWQHVFACKLPNHFTITLEHAPIFLEMYGKWAYVHIFSITY